MTDGRPERPTYTTGQYIGAADLNAAVDYNRDEVERLALSGRTWGIATGLGLIERTSPAGDVQMFIEPGIAWDGYGRPAMYARSTLARSRCPRCGPTMRAARPRRGCNRQLH